ncbi:hypothetical protein A3F66_06580 [candidate division TM6 bacterium RIFCSPHIGHO2_12_FULL_32_22]|nr:MAG: hypothetical protein A3F66_06580 [candidate division TM6 bacterium RIFCSPHIGHO2_12_FULL_32_22]
MKNVNIFLILATCFISSFAATVVEYPEDVYLFQANKEIVEKANSAAEKMGYNGQYQIMSPKKPGVEINPYNKFIASGVNPVNNLNMIIVNADWFKTLTSDQQDAFLAIQFNTFVHGGSSASKYVLIIYAILTWIIIFGLFLLLKRFSFVPAKRWQRFLIAFVSVVTFNVFFGIKIQNAIVAHFNMKHSLFVYEDAISKGLNRDLIISTLTAYDNALKDDINSGNTFFIEYEKLVAAQIENVAKK